MATTADMEVACGPGDRSFARSASPSEPAQSPYTVSTPMSRLDSFIRRLTAQRACLDHAVRLVAGLPGNALELGLGNGRTYDHLRGALQGRDIYVFERRVAAHPDCIPPAHRLFLGDFLETLPQAALELGAATALVHADIGSGDVAASRSLARALAPLLLPLMKRGAIVVSDQPIADPALQPLPLPPEIEPDRYFIALRT
jgi:hypothetical protein